MQRSRQLNANPLGRAYPSAHRHTLLAMVVRACYSSRRPDGTFSQNAARASQGGCHEHALQSAGHRLRLRSHLLLLAFAPHHPFPQVVLRSPHQCRVGLICHITTEMRRHPPLVACSVEPACSSTCTRTTGMPTAAALMTIIILRPPRVVCYRRSLERHTSEVRLL